MPWHGKFDICIGGGGVGAPPRRCMRCERLGVSSVGRQTTIACRRTARSSATEMTTSSSVPSSAASTRSTVVVGSLATSHTAKMQVSSDSTGSHSPMGSATAEEASVLKEMLGARCARCCSCAPREAEVGRRIEDQPAEHSAKKANSEPCSARSLRKEASRAAGPRTAKTCGVELPASGSKAKGKEEIIQRSARASSWLRSHALADQPAPDSRRHRHKQSNMRR
mmetsp:Transcript_34427/g.97814  ORF Transcript_34427/g.97814 Transcript_34427/m.97814 type:complete len:224 (-) Transcript_34427:336-1007(-)